MKKIIIFLFLILLLTGCNGGYKKYTDEYVNSFDTYSSFICYSKSEEEFQKYTTHIYNRLNELNKKFDIYNEYKGINNLKTINKNAGISSVEVDKDIIDILEFGLEAYNITNGSVNIAMGSVLSLWHDYRQKGLENPENAVLPPIQDLKRASLNTAISSIVIENNKVYIDNEKVSIDVGAIAKGYAAQIIGDELIEMGLQSGLLNLGGNIKAIGIPKENNKNYWSIGIQNPNKTEDNAIIDKVNVSNYSVVSSGNYQRYYTVDNKQYNHIIDYKTLMPAENFKSVSVIHENSAIADILSTALFIMPYDKGLELSNKYNAGVMWYFHDNSIKTNNNYKNFSKYK